MTTVKCARCGIDHDLEDLEPSYKLPDVVFAIPESEREKRTRVENGNLCALWAAQGDSHRWFVRAILPFRVHQQVEPCSWGLWIEVSKATFDDIVRLWHDPSQLEHESWPGVLANDAATYPTTAGISGDIRFVDLNQIPRFTPNTSSHTFVQDWLSGVSQSRVVEWQLAMVHADSNPASSPA